MSDPQTLSYESPQTTWSGVGIGTIALQLVGVYSITHAVGILALLAPWAGASDIRFLSAQMLGSLLAAMIYGVIAVLLIRLAPRISAWLFRDHGGGIMSGPITAPAGQYLQAIAFSVAGVVTMIGALPRLASFIWLGVSDMGSQLGEYSVMMIEPIAQCALGLVLFLQSKGLALFWHKIRTGGVIGPQPESEPEPASDAVHSDSDRA